jgi:short-subunit dehydrogenase
MNYFVVQNADTDIGHTVAIDLARQKKNLILIGNDKTRLEELKIQIRSGYSIYVHCLVMLDNSIDAVVRLCEAINDLYFVEGLINIVICDDTTNLDDCSINELSSRLTTELLLPAFMLHQLFPNLMLCADAVWSRIICNKNQIPIVSAAYRISQTGDLSKIEREFCVGSVVVSSEQKCSLADNLFYINI